MLDQEKDPYWRRKARSFADARSREGTLYDAKAIADVERGIKQWEDRVLKPSLGSRSEVEAKFETASGIPLKRIYTPSDVRETAYGDQGFPGVYPYLRG
ncbi:MAG TPA: methylmalonyl-CoA mutase family protein, partial [Nitrososphaerales archaeon]|nr:methylmalonyl-CoA mutase family protein [Nitrososphaerales archaeon]